MTLGPHGEQKCCQAISEFPNELRRISTYCKTIVLSWSRTVFLNYVIEEEGLSLAAWSRLRLSSGYVTCGRDIPRCGAYHHRPCWSDSQWDVEKLELFNGILTLQ